MTVRPARRTEWLAVVERTPLGAAGKLVAGNLGVSAAAAGVVSGPSYFTVAEQTGLPVTAVHTAVGDLVARGLAQWDGPTEGSLLLTLPVPPERPT